MEIVTGCTIEDIIFEPVMVESFDSPEQAFAAFEKYNGSIYKLENGLAYKITEYYLQMVEYNDEDNFDDCKNVYKISELNLPVINLTEKRVEKVFNSYGAAEAYIKERKDVNPDQDYSIDIPELHELDYITELVLSMERNRGKIFQ